MEAIAALRHRLAETPGIELAVLFGSAARENAGSPRDLDVGVLLDGTAPAASEIAVDLERASGRRVDLLLLDGAPPLLRFEVARDGRVLVERRPHAWSDFRARAMIDWWDWAPTARLLHRAAAARVRRAVAPKGPSGPA